VGNVSKATGVGSIALGSEDSVAQGWTGAPADGAQADGIRAIAIGAGSRTYGASAIAQGDGATAGGMGDIAIGAGAYASGESDIFGSLINSPAVAIGVDATAAGAGALAFGRASASSGFQSVAVGPGAAAGNSGDVALGANSVTAATVGTSGATIGGSIYAFAGATPSSTVSIGTAGAERTITNVAAGRLSSSSTDAVNGSQLYAAGQAVDAVDTRVNNLGVSVASALGGGAGYTVAAGLTAPSYIVQGATYDNVGDALGGVDTHLTAIYNDIDNIANGTGIKYFHANSTGADSSALGADAVAIGVGSEAGGDNSIAMGNGAQAQGADSISIGAGNIVSGDGSGAFGDPNTVNGNGSYAIGNDNTVDTDNAFVLGNGVTATQANSVVLGAASTDRAATAETGIAINGDNYSFAGVGSVAAGVVSVGAASVERQIINVAAGRVAADSTDAVNGSQLYATNQAIENLGDAVEAGASHYFSVNDNGTAGGNYDNDGATGSNALAAGVDAAASGDNSVAIGWQSVASGLNSTAMGEFAHATGTSSLALGATSTAQGDNSVALGDTASAIGDGSFAGGRHSTANGLNSTAIGEYATADGQSSFAGGATATASGVSSVALGDLANSAGDTSLALGANSVAGNANDVALGAGAVTAAAVGTANAVIDGVTYAFAGVAPTSTVSIGTAGQERTLTNLAAGRLALGSTDAVNGSQLYAAMQAIDLLGTEVDAISGGATGMFQVSADRTSPAPVPTGTDSAAGGAGATAAGNGSLAVGNDSNAGGDQSVALGNGATATGAGATTVGQGAVAAADGSVAIGQGASDGGRGAESYTGKYSGAANDTAGTVSVGNAAGGETRTISNVADGREATDAVNLRQLDGAVQEAKDYTDTQIANVGGSVTDITNGSAGMFQVSADANTEQPQATGAKSTAGGNGAVASAGASTAIGNGATATAAGSVALGQGSVADRADSVSVGAAGNERQITNVAAGTAETDAVNVGQLQASQAGTVRYDQNADGSIDYASVTMNAGGDPTVVHNVGAGTAPTDAVNVGQLDSGVQKAMDWSKSYTDRRFETLDSNLNTIGNRANAGIASSMAMASLPQAYAPNQSSAAVALGSFHGETGIAVGVSTVTESGRYVFKLNATSNTRGDAGVGVGAAVVW
jgi:autotransporter adhesin